MRATITQIYAGQVAEAIKGGDTDKIRHMITRKQKAMAEALELAEFYKSDKPEFAEEEATRVKRLQREISQLEASSLDK